MEIEYASESDFQYIFDNDKHISEELIKTKIKGKEILIVKDQDSKIIGWLRYNFY